MAEKTELSKLLPGEGYTTTSGEKVLICPVPFGKLRLFSSAVAGLLARLQQSGFQLAEIDDYRRLFDIAFEEVLGIMMLVLDKPREWFDGIDIGDGLAMLDIMISQNFNERSKKNLAAFMEKIKALWQTPSRSSSAADIDGQTSSDTQ